MSRLTIIAAAAAVALFGFGTLGANAATPVAKFPSLGQTIDAQAGTTRVPRAKPKKMKSQKTKRAPVSTMPKSSNQ